MVDNIVMPLGDLAGQKVPMLLALQALAGEMIRQATNLEALAEKTNFEEGNHSQSPETMLARAADLRRFGWAIWLVWLQTDPQAKAYSNDRLLLEMARQQGLTLPDNLSDEWEARGS
jgi:hypothetical protein